MSDHRIIFNWIKIRNFLSIESIDFDFSKHSGMNYVFGINKDLNENVRNGSGKTSIFVCGILFGLFGQAGKKINKPSVINRQKGKECLVEINFSINGDEYLIKQGVDPTFCHLYKNNEDISKASIKKTQEFIEKEILKTSYLLFKNSIILSINDMESIFQLSKYEKRDFVERLFNIAIFGKMHQLVKSETNSLDKEINIIRNNFNLISKDLETFIKKQHTFEDDKSHKIEEYQQQIVGLETKLKSLSNFDLSLSEKRNEVENKIKSVNLELTTYSDSLNKLAHGISLLNKEVQHSEKTLLKYSNIFDAVCQNCNSKLDSILNFHETKNKIPTLKDKIEKSKDLSEKLSEKQIERNQILNKLEEELRKIDKQNRQEELNRKEIDHFKEKIEDIRKLTSEESNKTSPFIELIEKYENNKKIENEKLTTILDKQKYLEYMVNLLSEDGVKKCIISNLINVLNSRIHVYLDEMGCEYTVIIDPNFNFTFLTTTGPCEYLNFSAGERTRINLSTMFAIRDLLFSQGLSKTNILVCDEILDASLDEFAINAALKILKKETITQTIYLISFRESISPEDFNNIIQLEKVGGFTRIISDEQGGI